MTKGTRLRIMCHSDTTPRGSAGTGRRARLRTVCRKACGFESHLPHEPSSAGDLSARQYSPHLLNYQPPSTSPRPKSLLHFPQTGADAEVGGRGVRTRALVAEFLNSRYAKGLSSITIEWYRAHLERFASFHTNLPRKPQEIESFLVTTKGEPETKHAYFRAIRAFFNFVCSRYEVPNPMAKVEAPRCPEKVMPTLEADQLLKLLEAARSERDHAVLTLFIDSGIRSSELATLRKDKVKQETIVVKGKSGEREVAISEETRLLLLDLATRTEGDYVFCGRKGPLTRSGVYKIVRDCMEKAGLGGPKLGGHRIRHAFGTNFLGGGGDIRHLQVLMGHRRIGTTQKYARLLSNSVIARHHQFTPLKLAHGAAQASLFHSEVVKQAEEILLNKGKEQK